MADDTGSRAEMFAFADKASDWLQRIYDAAHGPLKLGSPALAIPQEKVLVAEKFDGVVFVDLRLILNLIRDGLLPAGKSDNTTDDPA